MIGPVFIPISLFVVTLQPNTNSHAFSIHTLQFGTSTRSAAAVQHAGVHAMAAIYASLEGPSAAAPAFGQAGLGSTVLMGSMNLGGQQDVVKAGAAAMLGLTATAGAMQGGRTKAGVWVG